MENHDMNFDHEKCSKDKLTIYNNMDFGDLIEYAESLLYEPSYELCEWIQIESCGIWAVSEWNCVYGSDDAGHVIDG